MSHVTFMSVDGPEINDPRSKLRASQSASVSVSPLLAEANLQAMVSLANSDDDFPCAHGSTLT